MTVTIIMSPLISRPTKKRYHAFSRTYVPPSNLIEPSGQNIASETCSGLQLFTSDETSLACPTYFSTLPRKYPADEHYLTRITIRKQLLLERYKNSPLPACILQRWPAAFVPVVRSSPSFPLSYPVLPPHSSSPVSTVYSPIHSYTPTVFVEPGEARCEA